MKKTKSISFENECEQFIKDTDKACDELLVNFARALINVGKK